MDDLRTVTLDVLAGRYAVCRLAPGAEVPPPAPDAALYALTVTPEEHSLVCPEASAPAGATVEAGWACLKVEGPLDFALTGILAALTAPLAEAQLSVFAVSTYDTDYLLLRSVDLEAGIEVLRRAGHTVK